MSHVPIQPANPRSLRRAFTLIEVLLVVVILGILAAVVLPQFSNASHLTRENTLKDDVRYLRMQITVFKAQHHDVAPGYPSGNVAASPTQSTFLDQLTKYTDDHCAVSSSSGAAYPYGPYLQKMPPNPINGLDTILIVGNGAPMPAPTGANGWIYKAQTQEICPDLTGADSDGKPYADY